MTTPLFKRELGEFGMTKKTLHTVTIPVEITVSIGDAVGVETPGVAMAGPVASSTSVATGEQINSSFETKNPNLEGLFSGGGNETDWFDGLRDRFSIDQLTDPDFSWQNVLNQALCSTLAYESESAVIEQLKSGWGFSECRVFSIDNTECFVASSDEVVIVSFRGTQQTGDWLTNLNVAWISQSFGAVHRGFQQAFAVARDAIETALDDFSASNKQVWITGHSLGGALATIAAATWHGRLPINGVLTFGQPAVGFSGFRSFIEVSYPDAFHRFVNEDDIVPRVPPGYRHVGQLYHFVGDGDVANESTMSVTDHSAIDTPTMSVDEFERLRRTLLTTQANDTAQLEESINRDIGAEGFFPSVADHAMNRYLGKIAEQLS